jgi:diguanylate cyclase (GGDEF)-like protein
LRSIDRLTTPGALRAPAVAASSLAAMLAIFAADVATGSEIRLHILYVFPLAAIALHADATAWIICGFCAAVLLPVATFVYDGTPPIPLATDLTVAVAAALLVVFLARQTRRHYFLALSEARTDGLTRVANRRALEDAIGDEAARCERYGGSFCLALLDVDGFKSLNDARGHASGDAALRALADVLRARVRRTDLVGRLGGDEFVVLMRETSEDEARAACESLRGAVQERMTAIGLPLTVSIGCNASVAAPATVGDALRKADALLYEAKHRGRNRVVCASA